MGFFSSISLNNIGNAISHVASQITSNNVVGLVRSVAGGSRGATTPDTTQTNTNTPTTIDTHSTMGNVIAGLANAVTGGLVGNGANLANDSVSQAMAQSALNSNQAYQIGGVAGHILNSAITPLTGQVSTVLQNASTSTPAIKQIMDGVSDFAITSVQKTAFQRVADWVKKNELFVVAIALIPLIFIFKPFLSVKRKSTKRYYKR